MAEETNGNGAKAATPQINPEDFDPSVREELRVLVNLEKLLKRVKGIEGDEAFGYVEARQYIAGRAGLLERAELARLKAKAAAADAAAKATAPEAEAPAAAPAAA